jgi:hypothetical protein
MTLNIQRARVTLTLEMDYISSNYMERNYIHIMEFFKEIPEIQQRFEGLVNDSEDPRFKSVPSKVLYCEYYSNGEWVKSN